MSTNCNKLSLLGFTVLISGPFVSLSSSSRIHNNPSQLVPNFSSIPFLLLSFLGVFTVLISIGYRLCLFTGPKEFAALWSCLGQWRVSLFFISSRTLFFLKISTVHYARLWIALSLKFVFKSWANWVVLSLDKTVLCFYLMGRFMLNSTPSNHELYTE